MLHALPQAAFKNALQLARKLLQALFFHMKWRNSCYPEQPALSEAMTLTSVVPLRPEYKKQTDLFWAEVFSACSLWQSRSVVCHTE